jgi:protein gp37
MFAERQGRWGIPSDIVTRSAPATFRKPLSKAWRTQPAKVFTCSWSDWFHHGADEWRPEAWEIIKRSPHLTFQILTKRPGRILKHLPGDWGDGWPNVWLGVSVESQTFMHRAARLAEIPAAVRFVSAEPLLGPLEFEPEVIERLHWIIGGGESGPKARPADPDWFNSLAAVCRNNNVAYWHKQNGGKGADKGGNLLNGRLIQEFPR